MELRGKEYATLNRSAMPDKAFHMRIRERVRAIASKLNLPPGVKIWATPRGDGSVLLRTLNRDGSEWRKGEALPGCDTTAATATAPTANGTDASLLRQRLKRACDPRTRHIAAAVKAEAAGFPRLAEARRRLAEVARPISEIEADRDQVIAGLRERASQKEIDRREAEARGDDWRYCQLTREIESLQARIHGIETSKPVA